jgi:hypothetical protein
MKTQEAFKKLYGQFRSTYSHNFDKANVGPGFYKDNRKAADLFNLWMNTGAIAKEDNLANKKPGSIKKELDRRNSWLEFSNQA